LDAAPPPQPPPTPPAQVYAATDYRPQNAEEVELCKSAGRVDWVYLGASILADAGTIALDSLVFQTEAQSGVRLVGPPLVGLSWGFTVGGGYLALPKCSPDYVTSAPPEGNVRADWPAAVAFTVLATATAPVLVGIETGQGPVTIPWSNGERSMRLVLAGAGGAIGSLLPYLIPPRTWRAKKQLEHIRAGATAQGGFVGYSITF
jgi:hypothetical protein